MKTQIDWSMLFMTSALALVSGLVIALIVSQEVRHKARRPAAEAADGWLGMYVGPTIPGYRIVGVDDKGPRVRRHWGGPTEEMAVIPSEWKTQLQQDGCVAVVNYRVVIALGDVSAKRDGEGIRPISPGKAEYHYGDCVTRVIPE